MARVMRDAEADRVARLLMEAWEQAEGAPVGISYVATFVDMARAVIRDRDAAQPDEDACRFGKEEWQGYFIGERFCYTHGGHSIALARCPRARARDAEERSRR